MAAVDLRDLLTRGGQIAGQACPVAAGPLNGPGHLAAAGRGPRPA